MHRHRRLGCHSGHRRGPTAAVALSLVLLLLSGTPAAGAESAGPEPSGQGPEHSGAWAGRTGARPESPGPGSRSRDPGPGEVQVPADGQDGAAVADGADLGDGQEAGPDQDPGAWEGRDSWQSQDPWQSGGPREGQDGPEGADPAPDPWREPEARPVRDQPRESAPRRGEQERREGRQRREEEQRREAAARRDAAQRKAAAPRFKGWAFDTCHTQSTDTMRRWLVSRYRAVGVYFGGRGRACPNQPLLTHTWMKTVKKQGWKVLPLYVGSQSPCVFGSSKRHVGIGSHPWKRGTTEAADAVRRAKAIGIRAGSPLYLDVEAYDHRNKKCAATTLRFVRGWNRELRKRGYLPGFYSSAATGVQHMETARRAGVKDLPSVLWFARWRVKPQLAKEPVLARGAWPKGRIHQYAGNVKERHGGRTVLIDRNTMDAPVARIG